MSAKTLTALVSGVVLGFSASLTGDVLADGQKYDQKYDQQHEAKPAAAAAHAKTNALPWEEARLLAEVLERVRREYVEEVDDAELLENAVRGMVSALDPHSAFLNSEEYEEIRVSTMGSYPGVGIEVAAAEGAVKILYLMGRAEPLRLLLNQKDPAQAGRMLAYYGYFGRARAEHVGRIAANVQRIEELDAELASEERELAALEAERRAEVARLEQARTKRGAVLASLTAESRERSRSLEKLRGQKETLEKLLRELKRAMDRFPLTGHEAFAKLRGKLAWPVAGRVAARFGEPRAGGLKWDGVLVETERGTPVRSVSGGRVVYADWLPGLGLLAIVDHGEGYLSLYGHNERLYKAVGERVAAGDTIAAAGDSGGRSRAELYFEIRKGGKPVDPRPWFRSGSPRAAP